MAASRSWSWSSGSCPSWSRRRTSSRCSSTRRASRRASIKGKYAYMSPEQVRGDELDRRSDLFSLGVVLFELATHQRLFKRGSDFLSAKAILEERTPRADEIDPAVPRALADVIAKAL